jgi:L-fuconolactonase
MKLPVLDAHQHVWDLSVRDQPFLTSHPDLAPLLRSFAVADLRPLAAAASVTATVVVQTVNEPAETAELLALAAADHLVAAVVGWADLASPAIADALAALSGLPGAGFLAGLRHPVVTEPDPDWLTRPEVLRGLAAVATAGLAFDLIVSPRQLPAAVRAAAARPELTFVLDHLGNADVTPHVDQEWASALRQLAALPNTACKLSGILGVPAPAPSQVAGGPLAGGPLAGGPVAGGSGALGPLAGGPVPGPSVAHLRPYYQVALDSFGPDRMMFGSDWPVCTLGAAYGDVVSAARALVADLTRAEQEAILGQTARRVYRIS